MTEVIICGTGAFHGLQKKNAHSKGVHMKEDLQESKEFKQRVIKTIFGGV